MPRSLLLALKAEALFGLHLVSRHRAPRLAAALGLALAAAAGLSQPNDTRGPLVLLVGSSLAAVGGSRLLAVGPALAAARIVAARRWVVPVGRLAGALSAVGPLALGIAALVTGPHGEGGLWRVAWVTGAYQVTLVACTMAVVPSLGASPSATLAFLAVWLGSASPPAVWAALEPWPPVQWLAGWLWRLLPLPWRPLRWLAGGPASDLLLLLAWTVIGLGLAGCQIAAPSGQRAPSRRAP